MAAAPAFSTEELAELSAEFESAHASDIIRWAVDTFHPHFCLASSMTDVVLIDLAVRVEPSIEVVFIDTGYHFPETLETMERARRHYGLNLRVMTVARHDTELWRVDQRGLVKVNPLARWSDDDVSRYIDEHGVPTNPLRRQGYRSIGCAPCTRPVSEDEHPRAGRWAGSDKTECGLHL